MTDWKTRLKNFVRWCRWSGHDWARINYSSAPYRQCQVCGERGRLPDAPKKRGRSSDA